VHRAPSVSFPPHSVSPCPPPASGQCPFSVHISEARGSISEGVTFFGFLLASGFFGASAAAKNAAAPFRLLPLNGCGPSLLFVSFRLLIGFRSDHAVFRAGTLVHRLTENAG